MDGKQAIDIVRGTGLGQAEVARLIGVSETAVQKWANGGNVAGTTASLLLLIRDVPEVLAMLARVKRMERRK
jgi:DNA-binding transcriptional regulator YiaG